LGIGRNLRRGRQLGATTISHSANSGESTPTLADVTWRVITFSKLNQILLHQYPLAAVQRDNRGWSETDQHRR